LLDFELAGYPYHYWFPATKKGYIVAQQFYLKSNLIMCFGTGMSIWTFEGRNIRLDFDALSVMSLPSGTNAERLGHKFMYMDDFQNYITELKKDSQFSHLCDYNICHEAIDIHDPIRNKNIWFLPEERAWLDAFLKNGFVDSFRF
jgi:exodeoxyribonuclease-3